MDEIGPSRRSGSADARSSTSSKAALRRDILAQRGRRTPEARADDDAHRTAAVVAWLTSRPEVNTVACYLAVGDEPGTSALIAWLWDRGVRVLAPALRRDDAGVWHPDWATVTPASPLRRTGGLVEVDGPSLGAGALAEADVILAPGLAGSRRGDRLGRGAGWYDRALDHRRPDAPVCLLLNDDEVVDSLPASPYDQPVQALALPSGVIPVDGA